MIGFITELDMSLIPGEECRWRLNSPLVYMSELVGRVEVPAGFETDLSSVPRLPLIYWLWGGRAHREGVLHDALYRLDSKPLVSFNTANKIFLEAMKSRGKPFWVRWPMYLGVCAGGRAFYHKA
jgi:hypothetical protein